MILSGKADKLNAEKSLKAALELPQINIKDPTLSKLAWVRDQEVSRT